MLDIPVPSNQTIIIFSATGGASAEGGNVRQNISFTAQTAITITGGLENDWVRITPSGSTFIAVAKFHEASGSATFTATVSTAGDSEKNLAAASVEFTFRVLVLGVDFPHLTTSFFEFAVGDEVDVSLPLFFASTQAQLNIAKVSTAITSQTYGEVEDYTDTDHGSITRQRWVGASSGISLSPVLDEEEYVRGATLTGTATRPGIYYRAFEISSYDDGETTPFPGATGYGLVIINIYDDRDAPKLIVPYAHTADADFVRVIRHALTDPIADRLVGAFAKSGELWQRQVSEAISETVNDVWEYQIAYDAETLTWTLSGRTYLSDETVPDYTALATATGRFGTVPPNTGWTGSVLYAGDSGKYVPGYGFFDYKGERTVTTGEGEEEVTFASDVYEQQPVVAAQYEGWTNPTEIQFSSGIYLSPDQNNVWRIAMDATAVDGIQVTPQVIQYVALPYYPPTAADTIGGISYRDMALLVSNGSNKIPINAHLPTDGTQVFRSGSYVAGVPSHYTWLRQLPPPNGTALSKTIAFNATTETTETTREYGRSLNVYAGTVFDHYYAFTTSAPTSKQIFSGSIPVQFWMRHAVDILGSGMGIYESGGGSSIIYEYDNSYRHKVEYIDDTSAGNYTLEDETYTETERVSGAVTGSGQVMTAFASGRNESDSSVGVYCAGFARASGSVPTERVKDWSRTYQYGVAPAETETGTETTTYTRTSDVNLRSPAPYRTSFTDLAPGPFTQTTVTASMTGANSWGYTDFVDPEDPSYTWSNSVVATHERTQYSGTGKPSALIDTGWTHIVRTTVDPDSGTTVEDTWYSDPDGSVYEGLYDEFGIDFAESTLPSPSLSDYGSNRSSTRTETVTKRTEIFGE